MALERYLDPYDEAVQAALPESFRQMRNPTSGLVSGALEDQTSQSGRAVRSGLERFGALVPALAGAGLNLVSEGAGDGLLRSSAETLQSSAERGPDIQSWDQVQGAGDALAYARNMALGALPDVALALGTGGVGGAIAKGAAKRGLTRAVEGAAMRNAVKRAGVSEADDAARALVSPAGQAARRSFTPTPTGAGRTFADDVARLTPRAQSRMRASDGYHDAVRAGQAAGAWAGNYPPTVAASVMGAPDAEGNMVGGLIGADPGETAKILLGDAGAAALGALPEYAILGRIGGRAVERAIAQNAQKILPRVTREMAKQGAIGAGSGLAQTVAQLATHKWVDDNVDLLSPAAFSQYLDAVIAGGAIGGGLGGGIEGANALAGRAAVAAPGAVDAGRQKMREGLAKLAEARRKAYDKSRSSVDGLFRRGDAPQAGQPVGGGGPPADGGGGVGAAVGRGAATAQQMFTDAVSAIERSLNTPEGRSAWANAARGAYDSAKDAATDNSVATLIRNVTRGYNDARRTIKDSGELGRIDKAYSDFVAKYATDEVPEQATESFQKNLEGLNDDDLFDADISAGLRDVEARSAAFERGEVDADIDVAQRVTSLGSPWQNAIAGTLPVDSPFRFNNDTLRYVASAAEKMMLGKLDDMTVGDFAALDRAKAIHPDLVRKWELASAKNADMIQAVRRMRDDSPDDRPEALAGETDDGSIMSDAFAQAKTDREANRPREIDSPDQIDTGSGEGAGAIRARAASEGNAPRSNLREQMLAEQDPARRTELQAQYRDSILNSSAVWTPFDRSQTAEFERRSASPATVRLADGARPPPSRVRASFERLRDEYGDEAYQRAMQKWNDDPANAAPRLLHLDNLMRRHEGSRSALTGDEMTPFEMLQGALADLELAGIPYDRSSIKAGSLGKDSNGRDLGRITPEQARMLRGELNPNRQAVPKRTDADKARLREELDNEPLDPTRDKAMGEDEIDSGTPDDGRARVTRRPPPTERTAEGENISSQSGVAAVELGREPPARLKAGSREDLISQLRMTNEAEWWPGDAGWTDTALTPKARRQMREDLGRMVGREDLDKQLRDGVINARSHARQIRHLDSEAGVALARRYADRAVAGEFDNIKVREQKADDAGERRVSTENARREPLQTALKSDGTPFEPSTKNPGAEKSGGADGWYAHVMKRRNERAPGRPSLDDHVDLLLGKYDSRIRGRDGGLIDKGQLTHAEGKYIAALRNATQDASEGNKIRRALDTFDEKQGASRGPAPEYAESSTTLNNPRVFAARAQEHGRAAARESAEYFDARRTSEAKRIAAQAKRDAGRQARKSPKKPKRTEKSDDERRAERAAEIAEDVRAREALEDDAAINAGVDAATKPSGPHDHAAETRGVNALLKRMGFKDRLRVEAHTTKPRNGQYVPGERVIRLGDNLHGGERLEVLAHEIGHHVLRAELARVMGVDLDHFANLPRADVFALLKEHAPDLHASIVRDFESWKAANNAPGNSALDARLSRSAYYRSKRVRETASTKQRDKKVGDLSDDAYGLVFDFDEFVADQVARALTHSEAKSPAAKFFKGLADKLKLVYEKLFNARGKAGFAPAPSVDAWVRSMFDRTTLSVSEALGEPVPRATARAGVEAAARVHAALNTPPPPGGTPPGGTVPPLPPKGLRQLIKFIRTRLSPDERLILEKTLGNGRLTDTGRMNRHLARVYADQPGALRAMRDPAHGMEAKIALAYMAWEAGALKAGPHGGDVLHGISSDLFAIANLASNSDFALRIFEDIASGKIEAARAEGTPYDVRAQFVGERGTPQAVLNKATAVGRAVQRAVGKVLDANITRMRATGVPALRQVAAALQRHTGEGGSDVGLTLTVVHTTDRFLRRAADIFSGLKGEDAAQVLSALQQRDDAMATSDAAKKAVTATRAMFDDLHNYGVSAGVLDADQKIDRYWPVVMDIRSDSAENRLRKILGDPKFERRIREVMGVYDEKAGKRKPSQAPIKDLVDEMIKIATGPGGGLIDDGTKLTTAKFRGQNYRLFNFLYELGSVDDIKQFASLQSLDIQRVVSGYIAPLVKTVERARRFGAKDAKLDKLLADARAQGATPDDLAHAQFAVDAATGTVGLDGSPVLRKLFGDGIANRVTGARDAIGGLQAYQNARLLPLAVLSSLADPMGIGVRAGGDIGVAWKGIKLGLKSVFHKATREELQRMMDVLGSAGDFVTYDILQSNFSGAASSGTARKVNDWIFRANGLAGWTRATRYMALVSAHHFLDKHGSGASARSRRYLDELGLRPGDVRTDATAQRVELLSDAERNSASPAERARDDRVRTALMRFIDEAVLRPTSQQAPSWFADPYMGLITQYKHFAYAINDQIIRRIGTELRNVNFAVLAPALAYLPIVTLAEMTRGAIQYGPSGNPNRDDWGPTEYVGLAAGRSGLLGPKHSFLDAASKDSRYGSTFGTSFLGPTAQQGVEAWRTLNGRRDAGKTFENALPASALYKRWNDGIGVGSEAA